MPVQVELADIKGPEGERARKLYARPTAEPNATKPKRATRAAERNAARGRTARNRTIRGVGRRTVRLGKTAHRAAGSPGGVVAGAVALFVGAGIVVAVVKNPVLVTAPLRFIAAVVKAFTGLLNGGGGAKPAPAPQQNVARGN